MTEQTADARPILYLKRSCPFCLKVMAVLGETGQLGEVEVRAFWPGDEFEAPIRAALEPRLARVTFPALDCGAEGIIADSDAIVARYAARAGVDPASLPFYQYVLAGPFRAMRDSFLEIRTLKERLGEG